MESIASCYMYMLIPIAMIINLTFNSLGSKSFYSRVHFYQTLPEMSLQIFHGLCPVIYVIADYTKRAIKITMWIMKHELLLHVHVGPKWGGGQGGIIMGGGAEAILFTP